ncbi:hypothetical protein Y032_0067g134 [Ancylostoma ceylanicum]|uniref:FERM domain-containing protein n=1 Tax=Ancylostoma ceylanicum TaxID=53326 RepID=A0A016TYL5_9BILA|nr:hypothetical protein Y032_0067g134 [Ancylostoma ceylanicum]
MESSCSTPGSSRSRSAAGLRLPLHLQQPSSSNSGPAVVSPSVHSVRPGQTYVTVQTLTKENLVIVVNQKTKVHDVLWKCGEILEITEDKLFGLAVRQPTEGIGGDQPRHEYFFLDPAQKIVKYAPKQPRFSNWHNRSTENRPLLVLYFRVRVYIDQVRLLTCPKALEHYYLQLKDNFLDQWASRHSVSEERCWEMAALALKVDKGDNPGGYFRAEQYFPIWVIDLRGLEYVRKYMPAASEDLKDMSRMDAMMKFAFEASRSPFALNCHLYGLRRHKMDTVDNAVLGINAKGIEMCDIGEDGERIPLRALPWNRVTRLSFDRKKLTIVGADTTKMCLYAQTESKARYLLELCRAVHQTLLVLSHQNGKIAPLPQLFHEKSVDRVSTSSNATTAMPGEHERDCDSLLHDSLSSSGDRGQGSVSSKQRVRIKLDSNLDLKIEKMELEHIRQERAASQSSKTSDASEQTERKLPSTTESDPSDIHDHVTHPVVDATNVRPASVDSASQTIETGTRCAPVDVNFNLKAGITPSDLVILEAYGIPYQGELQYSSSGGSRSDSVQHSNEMLPESMIHSYHHEQGCARSEDADSTLRSCLPQQSSISLHDLRTAGIKPPPGYIDERVDNEANVVAAPALRWCAPDHQMQRLSASGQARSEPKIDSDLWGHPSVAVALLDSQVTANGGRLFTKKSSNGVINRVHSMPAHYHVINGYRSSPNEEVPSGSVLPNVTQPASRGKTRDPPPYERALDIQRSTNAQMNPHLHLQPNVVQSIAMGPLAAEAAGGQPAFPPASATHDYFIDEEGLSTERLRDFPMMHRLLRESNSLLSHQRRPSSCIDLTSEYVNHLAPPMTTGNFHVPLHRGDYFPDAAVHNYPSPYIRTTNIVPAAYSWRQPAPAAVMDLPPPPPYPAGRKAPMVM